MYAADNPSDTGDASPSSAELGATRTLQLRAPILTQQLQRPASHKYPLVAEYTPEECQRLCDIPGLEESTYCGDNDGYEEDWDTTEAVPFGAGCTDEPELEAMEQALWQEQNTDPPRGRKRQRT